MAGEIEKKQPTLKMAQVHVEKTELCYVVSIHRETKTFFVQLCKFSNEDLRNMQLQINQHCNKLITQAKSSDQVTKKLHSGDLVCAKYSLDQQWYRALILKRDKKIQVLHVLYIDYGNIETIPYGDVIEVPTSELPIMGREPFGVTCYTKIMDGLDDKECDRVLECLADTYIMLKFQERQTNLQWLVDIAKHAYNYSFWKSYDPSVMKITEDERPGMAA